MIFQREKKQLWRYASSNSPPDTGATNSQPQLPPHRQPQHHPQSMCVHQQQQDRPQLLSPMSSYADCCSGMSNSSSSMISRNLQLNTPPPPYSSVPYGIDCSGGSLTMRAATNIDQPASNLLYAQQQQQQQQKRCLTYAMSTETSDDYSKSGCCYGNYGDTMVVDDCEQSNNSNNSSSSTAKAPKQLRAAAIDVHPSPLAPATPMLTPPLSSFAATAANVFRNCCGAGCLSTETSLGSTNANLNHIPAIPNSSAYYERHQTVTQLQQQQQALMAHPANSNQTVISNSSYNNSTINYNSNTVKQQYFSCLMKKLKARQLTSLLQAVKSFRDPAALATTTSNGSNHGAGSQHLNCILLKRGLILGEDPYVIVCRLFLWCDLLSPDELKRLPICTNARDPVYICCNPLHWSRILMPETAPPPYQPLAMDRLRNEDRATSESSQNEGNSMTASMHGHNSNNSSNDLKSGLRVKIPESFTTDGEGRRSCTSTVWCEVAYWELAQRVGDRYLAEKSLINIYSEGPRAGSTSAGMCLKDLVDKKSTPTPESVQKTRQKIGLGVTLSQEADGVWLYNRSIVPIFLHSPTLNECWLHVCKVMPGYCVKAFDNNRAREQFLVYQPQLAGAQTGPIDCFSMRISFAKGWGSKYCRQDITACPCWLEVLFTRR